jgi:2Fe-2S ferredoxin
MGLDVVRGEPKGGVRLRSAPPSLWLRATCDHAREEPMPKITYITDAGDKTTLDVSIGMTVMRAAVAEAVPGIDADCGGSCACGTCHVYVDEAWVDKLPAPQGAEADMLEFVVDRRPNSRLSCQIEVTAAVDGLVVTTPVSQH